MKVSLSRRELTRAVPGSLSQVVVTVTPMSLTSLLRDRRAPLRDWFETTLPNVKPIAEQWKQLGVPTIVPEGERPPWGPLGTAIDYRIRYFFDCTPPDEFAASYSLVIHDHSDEAGVTETVAARAQGLDSYGLLAAALTEHVSAASPIGCVLDTADEALLARYCYLLALYEMGFRTGMPAPALVELGPGASVEAQLGIVDDAWVADLVALASSCHQALEPLFGHATNLNPTFKRSRAVGGADGDLIIDSTLFEVKTTKSQRPDRDWIYQLLGYVLLDEDDELGITDVGFVLGRIPALVSWPLDELLATLAGRPVTLEDLRPGFFDAAAAGVAAEREARRSPAR